jgi:curved DNA-binding protein CbpA
LTKDDNLLFILEEKNYYVILGLDEDATTERIHQVYKELARGNHPDRFPELRGTAEFKQKELIFQKITTAYNALKDPEERKQYNLRQEYLKIQEDERVKRELNIYGSGKQAELIKKERANTSFNNAKVMLTNKDYDKAIDILKNLSHDFPKEADYHSYLGLAMQGKGWTGYAQAEFKVALHFDPKNKIALENYKPSTAKAPEPKPEEKKGFFSKLFGKK